MLVLESEESPIYAVQAVSLMATFKTPLALASFAEG